MMPHLPYPRRALAPQRHAPAPAAGGVDLHSQFEDILDVVWKAEAEWRFDDRLDMALKVPREASGQ